MLCECDCSSKERAATDAQDETKAETEPDTSQCRTTTYMLPVYGRRPATGGCDQGGSLRAW